MKITKSALSALLLFLIVLTSSAYAGSRDKSFFQSVEGQWKGPGEIVAGKYKGTRFNCNLNGAAVDKKIGILLDGTCNVGIFPQKMSALIYRKNRSYRGRFLDGAKGDGLDIVSGRISRTKITVGIKRKKLNGAMVARLNGKNMLNVTISVRVGKTLVPVIAMTLARKN